MIVTTFMGILSVLFAYLAKYKNTQYGLKISFTLVFVFLAFRYNFGPDYKGYLIMFKEINISNSLSFQQMLDFPQEIGWVLLNRIFEPFGFFTLVVVLALLNCIVYYRFIKQFVSSNYYWFAVFLYIFSTGFLLTHASAMRQSIAIGLFVFSLNYLYNKKVIQYFLCIGIAVSFHYSAIILLPVFFLIYFNNKITMLNIVITLSVFFLLFIYNNSINPLVNQIINEYFKQYEVYAIKGEIGSGFGVVYFSFLLIVIMYYGRMQIDIKSMVFKIAILSFIFIPLSLTIQMIGRMGMYFTPATIVVYPIIQSNIKKPVFKILFFSFLILFTVYSYLQFFKSPENKPYFGTYSTILSQ